jgi:DNA-binding transcriptional regulator YiaG
MPSGISGRVLRSRELRDMALAHQETFLAMGQEERLAEVEAMIRNGMLPGDVARVFGVSYETVRQWRASRANKLLDPQEWALIRYIRDNLLDAQMCEYVLRQAPREMIMR